MVKVVQMNCQKPADVVQLDVRCDQFEEGRVVEYPANVHPESQQPVAIPSETQQKVTGDILKHCSLG